MKAFEYSVREMIRIYLLFESLDLWHPASELTKFAKQLSPKHIQTSLLSAGIIPLKACK